MPEMKRATIYFEPELHRALRTRAAESNVSISEFVNRAVRDSLDEDAADLAIIEERKNEPPIPFEEAVRDLKRRGKL